MLEQLKSIADLAKSCNKHPSEILFPDLSDEKLSDEIDALIEILI